MDENLVGYLLNALDPETQAEVERHLRDRPEAQQRVTDLRRSLEPLAADADAGEAPPDLWVRTLATVAEFQCRNLPYAPPPPAAQTGTAIRSRWRRADL